MSGGRLPASVGIVIGGAVGAIAALIGVTRSPSSSDVPPLPSPHAASRAERAASTNAPAATASSTDVAATSNAPASSAAPSSGATPSSQASVPATVSAPTAAPSAQEALSAAITPKPSPPLELPTTRDSLLRAEMLCDQRKDVDQCERAAQALEKGTAGPVDLEQAKRFKRIESTFLVMQCDGGLPHACFVLAAKYRTGTDVAENPTSAAALEKRGVELCRGHGSAPECP